MILSANDRFFGKIVINVYLDYEYECILVRFRYIPGDVLYCIKMINKCIKKCSYILLGISSDKWQESEKDKLEAEETFGEAFDLKETSEIFAD